MYVVSDRNESIIKSVNMVFSNVSHFACIWHISKNVCTNYKRSKAVLSDIFYSMAKAYRKDEFKKLMAKVEKINHRMTQYLKNVGYEKWSRVYATVNRGRMMTSNIAECINGCLVEAQELPIIDFLKQTRMLFGAWNCKNREITAYTKYTLGRKFEDILVSNTMKCSRMKVVASSKYFYSVYESGVRYIVCLERKTCNCGRFQLDEIPSPHAIAVLKSKNITDMHPYFSDYYKPEALANTYELQMVLMPDKKDWSIPKEILEEIILPPRYKRMPGRPKKGRKKYSSEKIRTSINSCSRCGHEGHNRKTCNFMPKEK
ncbi:uncharacterized protein LOC129880305 [Solanum dulcamara]|uniref:uncharacterized protein LOC129880305 n=1 Tax=Solanum dulcamara TaxID=45834 RepID=UPI002485045C|nr:uncharacterized protein LOC129880305 [Solanum dulcamara]